VAAAVRLEIADAVRDMEAALAGRKLVWVKRGLWARRLSAAAVAPYAGAVPTVGAGWGPLLSVTSGIAVTLGRSVTRSRAPGKFAYLHHLGKAFPDVGPVG